jgi:DNA-binding transcriptional MerR regulator
MNTEQLIKIFYDHQKNIQSIVRLLREISRLDQNRNENLPKIKQAISRLNDVANSLKGDTLVQQLANWMSQYESKVKNTEEEIRKRLGAELEKELEKLDLPLSGQYPELKAGLFTIELDFDQWKAVLWYGPKQERLVQCPLSVSKIASLLQEEKEKLGSQLPEEQLFEKLRDAYYRVAEKGGGVVPIIRVVAELSYLLQSKRFIQDPKRENYRSYSRADFSYDLFRIRKFQMHSFFPSRIYLTTATRDHTKRRSDFLWVPDDENGKGTTYSHLRFEEERK